MSADCFQQGYTHIQFTASQLFGLCTPLLLATISRKCLPFCSAPLALCALLLCVNKPFYSLSGPGKEREVVWGHWGREVKSVFRNVPGQARSWHKPDDCEGILGRGSRGTPLNSSMSSLLWCPLSLVLTIQSAYVCLQHLHTCTPARLSAIKNIIQPGEAQ